MGLSAYLAAAFGAVVAACAPHGVGLPPGPPPEYEKPPPLPPWDAGQAGRAAPVVREPASDGGRENR
jgi:hypothetical protein